MKGKYNFALGLILGMTMVTGTGAAAAVIDTVTAIRNTAPIYVDGERVSVTAYNIAGSNYFRLRDLADMVDFGVEWDEATRSVHISTDTGYVSQPAGQAPDVTDGSLGVGDVIRCSDGYDYTITNVDRWDGSMFASGPLPPLPEPTCDWSLLPQPALPAPEDRHFTSGGKEYLFHRNLYETRRMQYTLYNAIGANPMTWQGGKPVTRKDGTPFADLQLTVPDDMDVRPFWPWRSELVTGYFNSCPPGRFCMEAWDVYCDGEYRRTEYYIINL